LRRLGIRVSLDDYGTGYCSLTYLRNMALDEVKIDRSFVMGLEPDSTDADIVTSTLWLGRRLGLQTVAEGVETVAALRLLQELGCDLAQGYLLARPMPADQVLTRPPLDWAALNGFAMAKAPTAGQ
jgi:EAL domain-containing protein (putative c-di-GMP-specific phosphodiesterase class I)